MKLITLLICTALLSGCSTTGFAPVRVLLCGPAPVLAEHRVGFAPVRTSKFYNCND